jgi:DNA polymerase elongation subunit (family B)
MESPPRNWSEYNFPFARPIVDQHKVHEDAIIFKLIGDPFHDITWKFGAPTTYLCLLGLTRDGTHLLIRVEGHTPYMHSEMPESLLHADNDTDQMEQLRISLNLQMTRLDDEREAEGKATRKWKSKTDHIKAVSVYNRQGTPVLRYDVDMPGKLYNIKTFLLSGAAVTHNSEKMPPKVFDAELDFAWQCIIEKQLRMGHWYRVAAGAYIPVSKQHAIDVLTDKIDYYDSCMDGRNKKRPANPDSHPALKRQALFSIEGIKNNDSMLEINCHTSALEYLGSDDAAHLTAPIRVGSLALVCEGHEEAVPHPSHNEVVVIAICIHAMGEARKVAHAHRENPAFRVSVDADEQEQTTMRRKLNRLLADVPARDGHTVVFHTGSFDDDSITCNTSLTCIGHAREDAMLLDFSAFLRWLRPEFIVGWALCDSAMPFLVERANVLTIKDAFCASSVASKPMTLRKSSTFESRDNKTSLRQEEKKKAKVQVSAVSKVRVSKESKKRKDAAAKRKEHLQAVWHPFITFVDTMLVEMDTNELYETSLYATAARVLDSKKVGLANSQITAMYDAGHAERGALVSYAIAEQTLAFCISYTQMHVEILMDRACMLNSSAFVLVNKDILPKPYMHIATGKHMNLQAKDIKAGPLDVIFARIKAAK